MLNMSGAYRRPFASQRFSNRSAGCVPKRMGSRQAGCFLASAVILFQRAGRSPSIGWRGAMSCIFDDPRWCRGFIEVVLSSHISSDISSGNISSQSSRFGGCSKRNGTFSPVDSRILLQQPTAGSACWAVVMHKTAHNTALGSVDWLSAIHPNWSDRQRPPDSHLESRAGSGKTAALSHPLEKKSAIFHSQQPVCAVQPTWLQLTQQG